MSKTSVIQWCSCIGVLFLYTAIFQIQNVRSQQQIISSSTMLPFCIGLPGTLRVSQVIKIIGSFSQATARTQQPKPWLNIILSSECSTSQSPFYLRMQEVGNGTTIVGNTFDDGHWGEEKSGKPITFPPTGQFVVLIEIQPDGYQVTGNGIPLWTLPHRLSYTDIARLIVRGQSADIHKIELIDQEEQDPQTNTRIVYPVPLEQPLSNPTFPFWGFFPGGLQLGKVIRIRGYFPPHIPDRTRTTIDLCEDRLKGPVALHFDMRFKFSIDTRRVVRNFYRNGIWNPTEERDGPFPFLIGQEFTLLFHVQPYYYNISVDGVPYWTYNHRLPFTEVNQLVISNNHMDILEVAYFDPYEKDASGEQTVGNGAMTTLIGALQGHRIGIHTAVFVLVNHFLPMM